MKKLLVFFVWMFYSFIVNAQTVEEKLSRAVQLFEKDSQMRHAILGFAVMDAATGKMIYERNAQIGLAPASTQKIITSAAAFELLGKNYRYTTTLHYKGRITNGLLDGILLLKGSGDPTFGSWRYAGTRDTAILAKWVKELKDLGIRRTRNNYLVTAPDTSQGIPDGWIWQDVGNYYGAGAYGLNWKENQYDLILRSGDNVGDKVEIVRQGAKTISQYQNMLKSAAKGTGDNAYIYFSPERGGNPLVSGTIPVGEKSFSISGALPNPTMEFRQDLNAAMSKANIRADYVHVPQKDELIEKQFLTLIDSHVSPPLDSINYWFMRRSINMYGEALVRTIGREKAGDPAADAGISVVRNFWATNGIDKAAINIIDGSGLSPQNRITTDALVQILKYARTRTWYASFYESIPTYNSMKLKSGSIGGSRAFAGYHTSAQGKEYILAIIVNNYTGSSGDIVKKMYRVLDELK